MKCAYAFLFQILENLQIQLAVPLVGLHEMDRGGFENAFVVSYKRMWIDCGDDISSLYAGTNSTTSASIEQG
jgi:hypothetical protein